MEYVVAAVLGSVGLVLVLAGIHGDPSGLVAALTGHGGTPATLPPGTIAGHGHLAPELKPHPGKPLQHGAAGGGAYPTAFHFHRYPTPAGGIA